MRRLLLATTILVMIGLASAQDGGNTLTCSATGEVGGCYLERRVAVLADLELTLGVDAQAAYAGGRTGHLAPYVGAAWYGPTWSAWLEVYLPHSGIPTLGRPDWWRVGFTLTF